MAVCDPSSLPLDAIAAPFAGDGFEVSVAAPGDFAEVEALAQAADRGEIFEPLSAPLLSWFVRDNPSGPGFLVVARSSRDRAIVGHFLFYANRLLVKGADGAPTAWPAYLYVHLYVAPSFRRRGVFAAMFGFGQAVLERMGVPFGYTVPNPRSSPGFVKFGVPLLGTLPVRMAPAWRAWDLAVQLTFPSRRGIEVEPAASFDEEMVAAGRHTQTTDVCGARTVEGLTWRFLRRPRAEYAVWRVGRGSAAAGYAVTRAMRIQRYEVLAICDMALDRWDTGAVIQVVRRARLHASRPVELVMFQGGPPARSARAALLRAGLVHVPDRVLPQPVPVFGRQPGRRDSTAVLPLLRRWELTPCDWDVF